MEELVQTLELEMLLMQHVIVLQLVDTLEHSVTFLQLINVPQQPVEHMESVIHHHQLDLDLQNVFVQMDGLEMHVLKNQQSVKINVKMEENVTLLVLLLDQHLKHTHVSALLLGLE
jgi:hypothetical protein